MGFRKDMVRSTPHPKVRPKGILGLGLFGENQWWRGDYEDAAIGSIGDRGISGRPWSLGDWGMDVGRRR